MRIMSREILPNLIAPIIVYTTLLIPANILFEAALSFLGVGVPAVDALVGADALRRLGDLRQSPGGSCSFPGSSSSRRLSPSTCSATVCGTLSIRARAASDCPPRA